MPQSTGPAKSPSPARAPATSFERHRRRCAVCHHPDREIIENFFVHWYSPEWIAKLCGLSTRSLCNHAIAAGLHQARTGTVRVALEHIIQQVTQVEVTAQSVIDAVRAYTHIDDRGRWSEPPTTHIVVPAGAAALPDAAPHSLALAQKSLPALGRESMPALAQESMRAIAQESTPALAQEPISGAAQNSLPGAGQDSLVAPALSAALEETLDDSLGLMNALRQGTASAVPSISGPSGVSTPEGGRSPVHDPEIQISNCSSGD